MGSDVSRIRPVPVLTLAWRPGFRDSCRLLSVTWVEAPTAWRSVCRGCDPGPPVSLPRRDETEPAPGGTSRDIAQLSSTWSEELVPENSGLRVPVSLSHCRQGMSPRTLTHSPSGHPSFGNIEHEQRFVSEFIFDKEVRLVRTLRSPQITA